MASLTYICDFPFPPGFEYYGGASPSPRLSRDGHWYLACCGNYNGVFGLWVLDWVPPHGAVVVGRAGSGRGPLAAGDDQLFAWSSEGKRLVIHRVEGWVPPRDDTNALEF